MATTATLFAWAVPAFVSGSPVDHTWVTDFDNSTQTYPAIADVITAKKYVWLCWGSYHASGGILGNPTGFLGSQPGSRPLAMCLVEPNADSGSVQAARGTIFTYGVDGVCHQLANQVLYATGIGGTAPLTVKGARGYKASSFIYGTYGLQNAAWLAKIASCSSTAKAAVTMKLLLPGGTGMPEPELPDDFEMHARTVLSSDPEMLIRLLSLRGQVQTFAGHRMPSAAPPPAEMLNSRNQHLLDEAARLLGPAKFEDVFGFPPTERINLVDPALLRIDR